MSSSKIKSEPLTLIDDLFTSPKSRIESLNSLHLYEFETRRRNNNEYARLLRSKSSVDSIVTPGRVSKVDLKGLRNLMQDTTSALNGILTTTKQSGPSRSVKIEREMIDAEIARRKAQFDNDIKDRYAELVSGYGKRMQIAIQASAGHNVDYT